MMRKLLTKAMLWLLSCGGLTVNDQEQLTWSVSNSPRRSHGGGGGGIGTWLAGLIIVLFLAYIGMSFISTFQPEIGNLTYSGGGVGGTIFALVQTWLLPLALIGLLLYVVMHFLHIGRK